MPQATGTRLRAEGGKGKPGGRRAAAAGGLGPPPLPAGRRVLRLRPTRNARLGFPEVPRDGPGRSLVTRDDRSGAAAGRAGCWATVTVPGAAAGSGRSPQAQLSSGDLACLQLRVEGPRSAYARRPGGCSSELQAKFSAVPFGTGWGLGVVAVLPEHEPRPKRSGDQDVGPGSGASARGRSAPPARVPGARPPHRPFTGAGKRRARCPPAAPTPRTPTA